MSVELAALAGRGYAGPIILECTAPGQDPFMAIKSKDSLYWLETCRQESRTRLQHALEGRR